MFVHSWLFHWERRKLRWKTTSFSHMRRVNRGLERQIMSTRQNLGLLGWVMMAKMIFTEDKSFVLNDI